MRICRRGDALVVEAPAKLNLGLEVLGRRADGFHDLETVMVAISLRDTLTFRTAPPGIFNLTQRFALRTPLSAAAPPSGDDNLVLRAARLLAQTAGVSHGVEVDLVKRIPWQAGMGGGSSDAAATLLALNELWGLHLPAGELHAMAARLGSDLNFFIERTSVAVCRGRGEAVEARPLRRRLDFVVVQPDGGLSTADVFRRWSPQAIPRTATRLLDWLAGYVPHGFTPQPYNALQSPAEQLHPGVARVCRVLAESGAIAAAMTGSGSACFGLCRTRRQALTLAQQIRQQLQCSTWAVHAA
jgi:4-diphosphocytidyl-2-C-methyl-D-erythritol kinase